MTVLQRGLAAISVIYQDAETASKLFRARACKIGDGVAGDTGLTPP
jgi:hypothetical protein